MFVFLVEKGLARNQKPWLLVAVSLMGSSADYFSSSHTSLWNQVLGLGLWSPPISEILFCDHLILLSNYYWVSCARHFLGPGEWLLDPLSYWVSQGRWHKDGNRCVCLLQSWFITCWKVLNKRSWSPPISYLGLSNFYSSVNGQQMHWITKHIFSPHFHHPTSWRKGVSRGHSPSDLCPEPASPGDKEKRLHAWHKLQVVKDKWRRHNIAECWVNHLKVQMLFFSPHSPTLWAAFFYQIFKINVMQKKKIPFILIQKCFFIWPTALSMWPLSIRR